MKDAALRGVVPAGALSVRMRLRRPGRVVSACVASLLSAALLSNSFASAAPTALTAEDYARAERFMPWNESVYMINGDIQHHWIGAEDRFWYLRTSTEAGKEFVVVDAATGGRSPAFDQQKIAAGLAKAAGMKVDATSLPFKEFRYAQSKGAIQFPIADMIWTCQVTTGACASDPAPAAKKDEVRSPDGKWSVFLRDHNLWARPSKGAADFALTTDGVQHYGYASPPGSTDTSSRTFACQSPRRPSWCGPRILATCSRTGWMSAK